MIIIQTLLGGVTRLTGSGLSITEWKPIMGTLPPLNEQEWIKAFEGYKKIGQYKLINYNFNISDFKSIFFWEWFHRLWARLLSVVFTVGFLWFLITGAFNKKMIRPLIILFLLGGLQGLIGWLMVSTGLNTEDVHVHYLALSVHFIAAMILACYTLWFALKILIPQEKTVKSNRLFYLTFATVLVTFLQLTYGSFMAGSKAAQAAPTWPTINGVYVPNTLLTNGWIHDTNTGALMLNLHFLHRTLAYILVALLVWWFLMVRSFLKRNHSPLVRMSSRYPISLVVFQAVLGVITVLLSPYIVLGKFGLFESFAELHQMTAMCLLMSLIVNLYIVRPE